MIAAIIQATTANNNPYFITSDANIMPKNTNKMSAPIIFFIILFKISPPQYSIFLSLEFPAEVPFYLKVRSIILSLVEVLFYKYKPPCFTPPVSKQRLLTDCFQHFRCLDLFLIPFHNQRMPRFQNSHTLVKPCLYVRFPVQR